MAGVCMDISDVADTPDDHQQLTCWHLLRPIVDLVFPCYGCEPSILLDSALHGLTTVTGTIICPSNDKVRFCLQHDTTTFPYLFLDLPVSTQDFAFEIQRGMSRIVLECHPAMPLDVPLIESPKWTMYCSGRKAGSATRRKVTEMDVWLLNIMRTISTGAGIIPVKASISGGIKYLRGNFKKVVGSVHCESYYLVDPSGCLGQELSIFFHRL